MLDDFLIYDCVVVNNFIALQILMNALNHLIVMYMQCVPTQRVVTCVRVWMDTQEMDLCAMSNNSSQLCSISNITI